VRNADARPMHDAIAALEGPLFVVHVIGAHAL
jgi:hypothetical protein